MEGVSIKVRWVFWLVWIMVFPAGLYYSYQADPIEITSWWVPLALVIIGIISAFLPFKVNDSTIFLLYWVNLTAFLTYGMFFEVLLMQIVLIPLLIRSAINRHTLYRYAVNSAMMMIISIAAAEAFYALNISVTEDSVLVIFLGSALYILIHNVLNHLFLYGFTALMKNRSRFISKDVILDYVSTTLSLPYGLALFYLLDRIGVMAIFYLGAPFLTVALVLRLYNTSEKVNADLARAGEIGHQLAAQLKENEVLDLFVKKLTAFLPIDYAYILDVDVVNERLILLRRFENGRIELSSLPPVSKGEGISGTVWGERTSRLYHKKSEWLETAEGYMPRDIESVLSLPIRRNNEIVAVLLVASRKKYAYKPHHLPIIDLLCSYFAVAIQNAKSYQNTIVKSERCALTGLYNYRYFQEKLDLEFSRLKNGALDQLSLILVDIDYFKRVNDTYGHQSGNDLLCSIADVLREKVEDKGVVARYGGEEFVILLADLTKEDSVKLAEKIRKTIEETEFRTSHDLTSKRESILVKLTVSIGVSTAPEDTDNAKNLIRSADRALYIGAKRAGRNRVAAGIKQ
ncbi:GGDEF domain-containing protein [Jeotgalibacillus proteolyticus]|uniref:GGDEF domain-containing protein n=1 Tax=Jeotgalibacillus proteolyticus TaxID=2082395 RepID=A0A2S5GEV0_9BACL|nr:diguanylate cyclase [Jeotgalibacillus proteolyticus]PPA71550.1 GGDEF domain-containing protein [Jeotgalibacillus proteolyticus]